MVRQYSSDVKESNSPYDADRGGRGGVTTGPDRRLFGEIGSAGGERVRGRSGHRWMLDAERRRHT